MGCAIRRRRDRSRPSADYFGFECDIAVIRSMLDACTIDLRGLAKVRLLVRQVYDDARVSRPDVDAVILWNEAGEVTEGTDYNVVAEVDGRKVTPSVESGLLAGMLRAELLETGAIVERRLTIAELRGASRVADPSTRPTEVMRGGSGFAPTFFPGTAVAADAQPITITAGAEVTGIDFGLLAVRLARISGTVIDSRGRPAPKHTVMLNSARSDRAMISNLNVDETKADGRFTLLNVAPGEYRIDVHSSAEFEAIAQTGRVIGRPQGDDAGEFASVPIAIAGDDVDGIAVRTTPGHRLSGRLIVEGGRLTPQELQAIQVNAYDAHAAAGISGVLVMAGGLVQGDSTFEVRGLADRRLIRLTRLPASWTLKAVRAHGMDVTDAGIEIPNADVAGVEIVVTTKQTEVLGTITDARGTAIGDRTVIVFPDDRDRWTAKMNRYVSSVHADANGTFKVSALPPATYLVAVVEHAADGEWAEPENLERLRAAATKFLLAEGETRTLTLRIEK